MSHRTKNDRKKVADNNKAITDALTPKQRIKLLNKKLGKNKGATKERARLKKMIGGKK